MRSTRLAPNWAVHAMMLSVQEILGLPCFLALPQGNHRDGRHDVLRKDNDWVKNVLLWRLTEPDKEMGQEQRGMNDLPIKPSDAVDIW